MEIKIYQSLLIEIKVRIRSAQIRAALSANAEMIMLYWDIGKLIHEQQIEQGWGATVTSRLANDIKNELPEVKGFSERNLKFMVQFYKGYDFDDVIGKQAVSQLQENTDKEPDFRKQLVSQIPWGHNILLMQKIREKNIRLWYAEQTIVNGWSRDILGLMIKNNLHLRHGETINNFSKTLPDPESDLVRETLKDPYIFDFITLTQAFTERELETELVKHVEKFLLELGAGFAFVGRQYKLTVSDQDFYLDLLFYHLKMRCFIVIDLKKGDFKPEYAGKMNFYCSAVDELIRYEEDKPTIGLILCQTKDKVVAEYALRDMNKPIGISEFELTRSLPKDLRSSLPTIEEIENELKSRED
ncbi:YhcG family protein [Pedobacter cryoconitis]|uniref:Putative nuclease of restriction endonuclease-like (RecB) superfamily n=1 Tax=Pedobacter cryoconitis TaxID=188932 RepID=A0A7X0J6K4_9SPHI|nr:PDDEXK nuclease domain-containing protein [Pedobacter cryoconitis]MBB6502045.1 putative nuclease of restriction endonuclease-like (RecB) superfamily [Pedobacter cryoconitis]